MTTTNPTLSSEGDDSLGGSAGGDPSDIVDPDERKAVPVSYTHLTLPTTPYV